jgi:hypothetical protein
MNDTRWLYTSVDFGCYAYPSLARAVDHFDDSVEDVRLLGPSEHQIHQQSAVSPQSTQPS